MNNNETKEFEKIVKDYTIMYKDNSIDIDIVNQLCIQIEEKAKQLVSILNKEDIYRLLNHENKYIVIFIAKYALNKYPEAAKQALRKLRFDLGLIGMNARIILKEWKKRNKL